MKTYVLQKKDKLHKSFIQKDTIIKRIEFIIAGIVALIVCTGIYMQA
ncbi:hypothetical protein [Flavobacterium rhizosphaerae]|uniref:Uncharacterized protein n=1 Tax=Flavobacterium rhizosphaerae TaxID=3163298 RepID=A0ABW8YZ76_9FLAO